MTKVSQDARSSLYSMSKDSFAAIEGTRRQISREHTKELRPKRILLTASMHFSQIFEASFCERMRLEKTACRNSRWTSLEETIVQMGKRAARGEEDASRRARRDARNDIHTVTPLAH